MDLQFCLSEQHFSLDIVVVKLSELFQSKAFCQILCLVLMLGAEILILRLVPMGSWAGREVLAGEPRFVETKQGTSFLADGGILVCEGNSERVPPVSGYSRLSFSSSARSSSRRSRCLSIFPPP